MKADRLILVIALLVQSLLLYKTFPNAFNNPADFAFCNISDGLKNSFTLHTYVAQGSDGESLKLQSMNYPFGENLLYTDATPIIAGPLRVFNAWFPSLKLQAVPILNFVVLFGFFLSTWLSYLVLIRLKTPVILAAILAISLAWINPQATRILNGNLNLATSWLIPLVLLQLINWWEYKNVRTGIWLTLTPSIACFFHLYYLPILVMFIAAFGFFATMVDRQWTHLRFGTLVSFFTTTIVFALVRILDQGYTERPEAAGGYGVKNWKLHLDSLYTPYDFFSLQWIFKSGKHIAPESYGFLGNFALYTFLFLVLGWLILKFTKSENSYSGYNNISLILFLSGLPLLFTALGETINLFGDSISIPNLLDPFYYLHFFTERVTQFRCLGRFGWPFFWVFNILTVVGLHRLLVGRNILLQFVVWAFILGIAWTDAADFRAYAHSQQQISHLNKDRISEAWSPLLGDIEHTDYQAILHAPYWHVGSEIYPITLDPEEVWCREGYQHSLYTGLPLMAVKMSRTSSKQTYASLSLFTEEGASEGLLNALNDKPILIIRTKNKDRHFIPDKEPALSLFNKSLDFPESNNAEFIKEYNGYELWSWNPKSGIN